MLYYCQLYEDQDLKKILIQNSIQMTHVHIPKIGN